MVIFVKKVVVIYQGSVYPITTYPKLEHSPLLQDFLEHSSSLRAYAHGVD